MRAALLALVAAGVLAALGAVASGGAPAHPEKGYYAGKTTCGAGSLKCPRQAREALLYIPARGIFKFRATVTCRFEDGGRPNTSATILTTGDIGPNGRFVSEDSGDDFIASVKGSISGGKATGRINYSEDIEVLNEETGEEEFVTCRASGVRFSAQALGRPLFRSGRYAGASSCRSGNDRSACEVPQRYPLSFRVTRGALKDINVKLRCASRNFSEETPPDYVAIRRVHVPSVPLEWYGRFHHSRPPFEIHGFAREGVARGTIEYTGSAPGAFDDQCSAKFPFRATAGRH